MKNIKTINIPLDSEFSEDIKRLKQRKRKDNICKYCLEAVAVIGVISIGFYDGRIKKH